MIGPHGGYYAYAPVFCSTKNGELEPLSLTATTFEPDENAEWEYAFGPYADYSFSCKATISEDAKSQLFGFKNANCMSRYIRRMKRKKEQERRRRLKNGAG